MKIATVALQFMRSTELTKAWMKVPYHPMVPFYKSEGTIEMLLFMIANDFTRNVAEDTTKCQCEMLSINPTMSVVS
jgi:hypothetical protein